MTTLSIRFGVGDPDGARSSEWVVMWKPATSDVYIASRTLGGNLKVSLHESGQCHIRAPDPRKWTSPGEPPRFSDEWRISPSSSYEFPFGLIIPASELREAAWKKHKDRGTCWIPVNPGSALEIAVFFTRAEPRPINALASAGWNTIIVLERLPDGRDLWVVAGEARMPDERRVELESIKAQVRPFIASQRPIPLNPRITLNTIDEQGTRRFVEAAADNDE